MLRFTSQPSWLKRRVRPESGSVRQAGRRLDCASRGCLLNQGTYFPAIEFRRLNHSATRFHEPVLQVSPKIQDSLYSDRKYNMLASNRGLELPFRIGVNRSLCRVVKKLKLLWRMSIHSPPHAETTRIMTIRILLVE